MQRVLRSRLPSNFVDVKLESSEAYLQKLGKILPWDFEVIYIFRKNTVLNICRYFLKVPLLFITDVKNHRNWLNLSF